MHVCPPSASRNLTASLFLLGHWPSNIHMSAFHSFEFSFITPLFINCKGSVIGNQGLRNLMKESDLAFNPLLQGQNVGFFYDYSLLLLVPKGFEM